MTLSIKIDLQRITPQLDALQSVLKTRHAEAARVGAAAGGRRLPPMTAPGGGANSGGGATATTTAAFAAAQHSNPNLSSVDPISTMHGLTHSDAVIAGLQGHLIGVASSLRGVVAARGEAVAKSTERRQIFGGAGSLRDLGRPMPAESDAVITVGPAASQSHQQHSFAAVTQAQLSRDPELQYLSARAHDVAGLESTINELGMLFGRLAVVVAEQGASVERIDADLEMAEGDIERGTAQLQKAWSAVSSNRTLALRVLGVVVSFAIFYAVVLV